MYRDEIGAGVPPKKNRAYRRQFPRQRMPADTASCACGHVADEHGHDPIYPGSTACNVCGCIAFEKAQ